MEDLKCSSIFMFEVHELDPFVCSETILIKLIHGKIKQYIPPYSLLETKLTKLK